MQRKDTFCEVPVRSRRNMASWHSWSSKHPYPRH